MYSHVSLRTWGQFLIFNIFTLIFDIFTSVFLLIFYTKLIILQCCILQYIVIICYVAYLQLLAFITFLIQYRKKWKGNIVHKRWYTSCPGHFLCWGNYNIKISFTARNFIICSIKDGPLTMIHIRFFVAKHFFGPKNIGG